MPGMDYGDVHPHTVLPFVGEHAGGINKEGMQIFRMCRDWSPPTRLDLHLAPREAQDSRTRTCNHTGQGLGGAQDKGAGQT